VENKTETHFFISRFVYLFRTTFVFGVLSEKTRHEWVETIRNARVGHIQCPLFVTLCHWFEFNEIGLKSGCAIVFDSTYRLVMQN
jgi:hypothetical protein